MKNFTNNFKQFTSRLSARWLIMALMMLVGTSSAWAANVYITTTSTHKINFFTWNNTCNSTGWPGVSLTTNATKNDDANGGGFYKFPTSGNCSDNSYNYIINGSGQTGDLSISSTTWGVYNGSTSFTVLMTEANMSSKSITFRSDALSGWSTNTSTTWDATKKKYKTAEVNYSKQSGIDVYIAGTKFIYKAPANFGTPATGNYIIYWDPYTSDITFETPCPSSVTPGTASGTKSICSGDNATVTLTGYTEGATIQWQKSTTSSTSGFANINGATSASYTANNLTQTTYFRAVVTLSKDGCDSKTDNSGAVTITVNSLPAAPTLSPNTDEVCSGKPFTLPGDYNWYEVSTGGTKLNSATISGGITSNKSYWAEAKNASGCVSSTRTEYTLTVNDKPVVPTLSADNTSLIYGDKAVFTVGNTVSGLTYTLYNGENSGKSLVSEGRDLTFKAGDAGSYTVKVTNSCGTSTSTPAVVVTVCTPQTNEFRHANSSYTQLANQPTYYPGDKAYFVSTGNCCLTGTWSNNLQKGEEGWWTGLKGSTPQFYMTLTRAGEFTITNMATNGCTQDKNVKVNLDFTVTALSQVTNANGTASGADIALTWKHSTNHTKVMVVRYPTAGTETIPAGGQSYSAGNTLGEGTVVYVGTSESYTDKNLPSGESYKYYFYTVNNNYYSDGVVLNMSSCPIPAKPSLSSTAITACNGECTAQGYITINNMNDYKDDTYTFELGNSVVTPDANGRLGINSTAYTQYTVTVTNSCGNPNSATVDIAINDNKPTITGATYTQPGKSNAITLTAANGILADWSVDNGGDLSKTSKSNTTEFSAEENGTYIITADNKGCTDTHVVTVSDAFYVYMRQPKKGETAYNNFYYPTQNPTQGGDLSYKEYSSIPPAEGYTDYNQGGRDHDVILTDCDGYVWYGFKASAQLIDGTNYFTVHAPNKNGYDGWFTHTDITKPGKMTGDIYYIMGTEGNGSSGWKIEEASAPYSGPVVHALGSTTLGTDEFAALYVTDCSGKEIDVYQWEYCRTQDGTYQPYSSVCSYTFEKKDVVKTENSDAGQTNNIRPSVDGYYRCKVTYKDRTTATSATEHILGSYSRSFTSTIPVLVVNTGSKDFPTCPVSGETASKNADKMKKKLSVDVKIYDGTTLVYDRKARMAYRGSSSLNFLKKSYAFCPGDANCGDAKKGADYVKTAKLNMLGIGDACDKDWVLYAAAADPSMLRNRMVFETYQAMRPGEWGVKSRYVELIINGEYKGVYLMMDKITQNEKRVNVEWSVKDETKRGFILKFDKTDVVDRSKDYPDGDEKTFLSKYSGKHDIGTYDATNDQAFEIEYPEKEDIEDDGGNWYDVINFIQGMINNFETALSAGEYQKVQQIIDYESWADWFILSEYTKNVDAFRASCVFVYDGTKLKATPLWDQELSFNNQSVHANRTPGDENNKGCENVTGLLIKNDKVYSDGFAAPFWFTGKLAGGKGTEKLAAKTFTGALLNDPCFVQMVKNRWEAHKSGALSNASLTALITNYEKELTSEVRTREANFWKGKSRNTLSCPWPGHNTGYHDDTYADAKADITAWISDAAASGSTGRRAGLSKAIDALKGTGLDIAIKPASIQTTPWVPVVIQVQNETGYDYTLTYPDGELDKQPNIIIEKSGDTYKYHIPRPATWTAGNELEEGERTDISYGIKATLQVGEGNNQCGSKEELPSATATIVLQDEPNEICQ